MNIRKITPEVFNNIKELLACGSVKDVVEVSGFSRATVSIIKNCDSYEDYVESLKSRTIDKTVEKVKSLRLTELSGEPLFWRIHSDGRNLSLGLLAAYSGLSRDVIKSMKEAPDYETFCAMTEHKKAKVFVKRALEESTKVQIRKMFEEGYSKAELASMFNVTLSEIEEIFEEKPIMQRTKKRLQCNEGIVRMIVKGFEKGLTTREIQRELPYSTATINRARYGAVGTAKGLTEDEFDRVKSGVITARTTNLQNAIQKAKTYLDFSANYYAKTKVPSWMEEELNDARPLGEWQNEWIFDLVQQGKKNGASAEQMAKSLGVMVEDIENMMKYPSWIEYIRFYPAEYVLSADKDLFDDVLKVRNKELTIRDLFNKWHNAEEVVFTMQQYEDFNQYLIGRFFKGVKPYWLEKDEPIIEESVLDEPVQEEEPTEEIKEPVKEEVKEEPQQKAEEDKFEVKTDDMDFVKLIIAFSKILSDKTEQDKRVYKLKLLKYIGTFLTLWLIIIGAWILGYLLIRK